MMFYVVTSARTHLTTSRKSRAKQTVLTELYQPRYIANERDKYFCAWLSPGLAAAIELEHCPGSATPEAGCGALNNYAAHAGPTPRGTTN